MTFTANVLIVNAINAGKKEKPSVAKENDLISIQYMHSRNVGRAGLKCFLFFLFFSLQDEVDTLPWKHCFAIVQMCSSCLLCFVFKTWFLFPSTTKEPKTSAAFWKCVLSTRKLVEKTILCTITERKSNIFVERMQNNFYKWLKSHMNQTDTSVVFSEWFCRMLLKLVSNKDVSASNAVLHCFINQTRGPLGKQQGVLEEPCDLILGASLCFKNNYSGWETNDKLSSSQETILWNRETPKCLKGNRTSEKCPHYS